MIMSITEDMIREFLNLMEEIDELQKDTFKNVHQGYPSETLKRFLKARDGNVRLAHKMLVDCLDWRIKNEIDTILTKPIIPVELYRALRQTNLIGLSGYSKEGHPVIAIGAGLSTYGKASVNYYVQSHIQMNEYRDRVILPSASIKYGRHIATCFKIIDMTGLRLSALSHIKLLTDISTIDDLNYPEKTETYYVVNAPYIFSACWKVVKPLLKESTRKKIQVLQGSGRDELLKIIDYDSLPHFCKRDGSGSSRHSKNGSSHDCFSLDHEFHQELYNFIKRQAELTKGVRPMIKHGSLHIDVPEPNADDVKIVETIETEFQRLGQNCP